MPARAPAGLLAAITQLGIELPTVVVEAVCAELESLSAPTRNGLERVVSRVSQPATRKRLTAALDLWCKEHPAVAPSAIALSLRAAAAADAWHRSQQHLEVVWTGPAAHGTTLRRTDQVLLEMIHGARETVTIVTFAAYRVPEIHRALLDASDRGIRLTFIVESLEEKVSFDPLVALGAALAKHASVYEWPPEQRGRDDKGRHGTLHAKCAIADASRILVSSANFTGDAMALNMELGLLVEGSGIAREVSEHLEMLRTSGVLRLVC